MKIDSTVQDILAVVGAYTACYLFYLIYIEGIIL